MAGDILMGPGDNSTHLLGVITLKARFWMLTLVGGILCVTGHNLCCPIHQSRVRPELCEGGGGCSRLLVLLWPLRLQCLGLWYWYIRCRRPTLLWWLWGWVCYICRVDVEPCNGCEGTCLWAVV